LKFLFDNSGIIRGKRVLGGEILTCPEGRLIGRIDGDEQAFPKKCRLIGCENVSSGMDAELCAVASPCRNSRVAG
jgi:hypothetical protein